MYKKKFAGLKITKKGDTLFRFVDYEKAADLRSRKTLIGVFVSQNKECS